MRLNSVVINTTHGFLQFPHLTKQVKSASTGTGGELQAALIQDSITVAQTTTRAITAFVDQLTEWNTTCTVTPVEKSHRRRYSDNIPFNFNKN